MQSFDTGTVVFPVRSRSSGSGGADMDEAPLPSILVVEDEFLVRELAVEMLGDLGYAVLQASTVTEAIDLISAMPPGQLRGVLTDIQMPGELDGVDLAIHLGRTMPDVGIVVTSGRQLPGDRQLPKGARFIPKPWTYDQLTSTMEALMPSEGPAP
jgi:Response regulator containing CheY-like receiver, AAA-type ATPase, and DNA-binding domains